MASRIDANYANAILFNHKEAVLQPLPPLLRVWMAEEEGFPGTNHPRQKKKGNIRGWWYLLSFSLIRVSFILARADVIEWFHDAQL